MHILDIHNTQGCLGQKNLSIRHLGIPSWKCLRVDLIHTQEIVCVCVCVYTDLHQRPDMIHVRSVLLQFVFHVRLKFLIGRLVESIPEFCGSCASALFHHRWRINLRRRLSLLWWRCSFPIIAVVVLESRNVLQWSLICCLWCIELPVHCIR